MLEVVGATDIITSGSSRDTLVCAGVANARTRDTEARRATTAAVNTGFAVATLLVGTAEVLGDDFVVTARERIVPVAFEFVRWGRVIEIGPSIRHADRVRAHRPSGARVRRITQRLAIAER